MLAFFLLCSCVHASGGAGGFLSRASWLKKSLLVPPVAFGILEAYSRAPPLIPPTEAPPPLLPPGAAPTSSDLVVVLPGAGGPDANTARIAAALRAPGGREVVEYDWRPWKGDELRAPYDALRLGTRLGTELGADRVHQRRETATDNDGLLNIVVVVPVVPVVDGFRRMRTERRHRRLRRPQTERRQRPRGLHGSPWWGLLPRARRYQRSERRAQVRRVDRTHGGRERA